MLTSPAGRQALSNVTDPGVAVVHTAILDLLDVGLDTAAVKTLVTDANTAAAVTLQVLRDHQVAIAARILNVSQGLLGRADGQALWLLTASGSRTARASRRPKLWQWINTDPAMARAVAKALLQLNRGPDGQIAADEQVTGLAAVLTTAPEDGSPDESRDR